VIPRYPQSSLSSPGREQLWLLAPADSSETSSRRGRNEDFMLFFALRERKKGKGGDC